MAARKVVDCRLFPSENNCTLTISGTEEEVLKAATEHAVSSHGHEDTPEFREQLRAAMQDEKQGGRMKDEG
jgi:predicted small metal-binding protein